jgi:nitrite reductase (NADH) small subunit
MTTPETLEVDAGALDELAESRGRCAEAGAFSLAIFRQGDQVFALENACPHRGGPLCEGDVKDGVVYCPLHAWGFDLRSGRAVNVRWEAARVFPARVDGGRILVAIPKESAWASSPDSDPWSEEVAPASSPEPDPLPDQLKEED